LSTNYLSNAEALSINAMCPAGGAYGIGTKIKNALDAISIVPGNKKWYVDGDNGADGNEGHSWDLALQTIGGAINKAVAGDVILIKPRVIAAGGTDPINYAETLIIPATKPGLSLIGYNTGRTQGGMPQINMGSGSAALITIRAPGCLIAGLGINGSGSIGGGILLDDDSSTKSAFGTTIWNCHFKNCKGSSATDARTGGAIQWSSTGGGWQVFVVNNRFYKNVGDIVLLGTSISVPQDIIIENNVFGGLAANVDCNIYLAAGSGVSGVIIRDNDFPAFPALGGGSVVRFMDLTGCTGLVTSNTFADTTTATGYGAAKAKAKIPTGVFMPNNYNESGLITREA